MVLVAEDGVESLPVAADAAVELREGQPARRLPLVAAVLLGAMGEEEGFGVSVAATALAFGGGGDRLLPPARIAGGSAGVVRPLGHPAILTDRCLAWRDPEDVKRYVVLRLSTPFPPA
jgi:hypothetical protein